MIYKDMNPNNPQWSDVIGFAPLAASQTPSRKQEQSDAPTIPSRIPVLPRYGATVTGRDGNKSICTLYKAYELHPDILNGLASLADRDCYKCKASGISRWRAGGLKAQVCVCVLAKQERAEEFMKTVDPSGFDPGSVA